MIAHEVDLSSRVLRRFIKRCRVITSNWENRDCLAAKERNNVWMWMRINAACDGFVFLREWTWSTFGSDTMLIDSPVISIQCYITWYYQQEIKAFLEERVLWWSNVDCMKEVLCRWWRCHGTTNTNEVSHIRGKIEHLPFPLRFSHFLP